MTAVATHPSTLNVCLNGRQVATLSRLPGGVVTFSFDPGYVEDELRPTLSWGYYNAYRQLKVRHEPTYGAIPAFFANLLPEADLRRYVAYRAGISRDDDFGLLWVTGDDLPGAVTVSDPHDRPLPSRTEGGPIDPPETRDMLRFSLAGVQLKFSAVENSLGGLTIRASGRDGNRLVKLPSTHYPQVPENEFAMMQFARQVGIEIPDMRLIDTRSIAGLPDEASGLDGPSLSIDRFDRPLPGIKTHIEDFNQIYRQSPDLKYDNHPFADIARTVFQAIGNDALIDFVRRLVFNIGIGNNDMHLKNWSFIYPDGRTPRLAPAYDYLCTKVYLHHNQTGLAIGSARFFPGVTAEQFDHLAKRAGVSTGIVRKAARDMVERMHSVWPQLRDTLPFPALRETIDDQLDRVPLFNPKREVTPVAPTEELREEIS